MGRHATARPSPLHRLGAASARRPWIALVVWAVLVGVAVATAIGGVTGETLFERLIGGAPTVDGESSHGDDLLAGDAEAREQVTLLVHGVDPADADAIRLSTDLGDGLDGIAHTEFVDPLVVPPLPDGSANPAVASLIADDGEGFLLSATIAGADGDDPDAALVDATIAAFQTSAAGYRDAFPDATVEVGGGTLLVDSIIQLSENDLARGETVALPIALAVMLVVFGGFIAAGIPMVGAIAAIVGGLGALFGFTRFTDIDTSVVNVITAVGLGLSIDYGLLMVSRFREERRRPGATTVDAAGRATNSAGRTVLFSGTVFAIAALGMLVFEPRIVRAVGLGAFAVTIIAIASALTLIPALLGLSGDRLVRPGLLTRIPIIGRAITSFGDVAPAEGFFSRLTRRVQRHPAIITLACTALLVGIGSPLLTLQLANTSVDALPTASAQYDFVHTLTDDFPDATGSRVTLVTRTEADLRDWAAQVSTLDHVDSIASPVEASDGWSARVRLDDAANGIDVVHEIRDDRPDYDTWVTGTDARTVDFSESLLHGAPWAALVIALGTVLLLFLMTGSLVVPLKALVASALSLGASIGVLVWGFEQGNFAGVMAFDAADVHGIDVLVLVLTFVFGFGLAMDYEMFILSRITELVDAGVDTSEAIARGLQRSGRIITSAALIIIVVFAGFATGDLMVIKQLGVALAVAVLFDATLVRCLLVPAFMTWQRRILGWAPRWLKPLHERFALRE